MRILGIETSSRIGSVALVETNEPSGVGVGEPASLMSEARLIAALEHEHSGRHAERILPLIALALEQAGWLRSSLSRVAVGTGPGSFTGLRVGIALGQGIALGLGIPVVGVSSLRALSFSVPPEVPGLRVPLIDARREEVFLAAYDEHGREVQPPTALSRSAVSTFLASLKDPYVCIGEAARELDLAAISGSRNGRSFPHATETARLGAITDASPHATYVHGPGVTPAPMPPSPFARPLTDGD